MISAKYLALIFFFISNFLIAQSPNESINPAITAEEIQDHINYLASDELKGRLTGSDEILKAAEYLRNDLKRSGILPLFGDSYFQRFTVTMDVELTDDNELTIEDNDEEINLAVGKDYTPLAFSGSGEVETGLAFVGYGITADEMDYDDYANIDVNGKVVIVLRQHPESDKPRSKFDRHADLRYKSTHAKNKGAAGVIFINGYYPEESDELMELKYDRAPGMGEFPVVQVKRDVAEKLLSARGINLKNVQKLMNDSLKTNSLVLENATIEFQTDIKPIKKEAINVAGYLEGNDPELKNEYVVVGAHYDHLGMGEYGSLYRGDEKMVHNGADDNASGTTGVIELAEKFASQKNELKRSMIFVLFSGEEMGLLGSAYFVDNSPIEISKFVSMFNMDMIGRMDSSNNLMVHGAGTSSIWKTELENINKDFNFTLSFNDEGFGASDHSSFYAKEIPVLFFFTGTHGDYHKPSDDADKIEAEKQAKLLKFVYSIVKDVNVKDEKPDYVNVPRKESSRAMSSKIYVGTVPDFAGNVEGYKISGVTEGSPAQKGGLKEGDIIVKFGEKDITSIYDFMYAMSGYVPGDMVDVVVKRGEEQLTLNLTLEGK